MLSLRDVLPTQHFTEPPLRFSEGSLVKRLEELGVGRPSTYSGIMKVLPGLLKLEEPSSG